MPQRTSRHAALGIIPIAAIAGLAASASAQVSRLFDATVLTDNTDEWHLLRDIDGDGDIDVIGFHSPTLNVLKTRCTPYLNDGAGNLTPVASLALPADTGHHVHLADVDGDGRCDLLISTANSGGAPALRIYRGLPAGQFAPAIVLPTGGNVLQLGSGDANGDGIDDVYVMHFDGSAIVMRWVLGSPLHAFALGAPLALTFELRRDHQTFDFDGDGDTDVAMLHDGAGAGLDLYTTQGALWTPFATLPLPNGYVSGMARLDVDGDGDDDLLVLSLTGSAQALTPYLNQGGGVFTIGGTQTLGYGGGWMFPGDLDGDGDDDFVLRGPNSVATFPTTHALSWYRNDGGTFAWVRQETVPAQVAGNGAGAADLDGDGHLDYVDSRALRFGHAELLDPALAGTTSNALRDWDGDGDLDRRPEPTESLDLNDGTGAFTEVPGFWPQQPGPNTFWRTPIAIADFDGNGLQEALLPKVFSITPSSSQVLGVFRFEADGDDRLVLQGQISTESWTGGIAVDADGDGDLDLVNGQGVVVQGPLGTFTLAPRNFELHVPTAAADVDGDGDLDLLANALIGTGVAWIENIGPLAYAVHVLAAPTSSLVLSAAAGFADLDDDGDVDIFARRETSYTNYQVAIWSNTQGQFAASPPIALSGYPLVGDVDGDGLTDLCVQQTDRLSVLRRIGPGITYAPAVTFARSTTTSLDDLDQDGDLDLCGYTTTANLRFAGPTAGQRRQYGRGAAGTGGRRPLLSAVGPVRAGGTMELLLVRAPGAATALMFIGATALDVPDVLPGVTAYVGNLAASGLYLLNGSPGVAGDGALALMLPLSSTLLGVQVFYQALVLDPATPIGLGHSNGLEVEFGG